MKAAAAFINLLGMVRYGHVRRVHLTALMPSGWTHGSRPTFLRRWVEEEIHDVEKWCYRASYQLPVWGIPLVRTHTRGRTRVRTYVRTYVPWSYHVVRSTYVSYVSTRVPWCQMVPVRTMVFSYLVGHSGTVRTYYGVMGPMLCHNFLIGKGHTCAPRTMCVTYVPTRILYHGQVMSQLSDRTYARTYVRGYVRTVRTYVLYHGTHVPW